MVKPAKRRSRNLGDGCSGDSLVTALMALEEPELTSEVIRPLIEALHPGRIEYTHSPVEAGRDLVSFGQDVLGRTHTLCVQVKARAISYGATGIAEVTNVATLARTEGVTRENGEVCIPNEVWFITSHPFQEQKRRQVSFTLQSLDRNNIKFISGDELGLLVSKTLPALASLLTRHLNIEAIEFITQLSKHQEGRAFGFSFDRQIQEYYITAALSSNTRWANAVVSGQLALRDRERQIEVPLLGILHFDELQFQRKQVSRLVKQRLAQHAITPWPGQPPVPISFDVKEIVSSVFDSIADAQQEAEEALEKLTAERNALAALRDQIRRPDTISRAEKLPTLDELFYTKLTQITISVLIRHELSSLSEKLVAEAKSAVDACPKELTSDVKPVRLAIDLLGRLDEFTRTIWAALDLPQPSLF